MTSHNLQLVRYQDGRELAEKVAQRLVDALIERQSDGRIAQLCLTGGRIAMAIYARFGEVAQACDLDLSRLELWWGDERFVPADDPERNAGPTLALLARHFLLDPSRIHPMPSADGQVDAAASAATYAKELGDTIFDVCLLGVGPDGHVASIFPHHPSIEPTTASVIGVVEAPKPPPERISLSIDALNRSAEVWFLVSGTEKADAVARAIAGDVSLPAAQVSGRENTLWLTDEAAAAGLPFFDCAP